MGYIELEKIEGKIKVRYVRLSDSAIKEIERNIKPLLEGLSGNEAKDRLAIQDFIDETGFKYDILYNGNAVYSYDRIMKAFKRYIKSDAQDMSDELYEFFHLNIGAIAHYYRRGWMATYPTIEDIKNLFDRNEYRERAVDYIPGWKTDVKRIVDDMQKLLNTY